VFDHITLRVADLAASTRAFAAVLDDLEPLLVQHHIQQERPGRDRP
jgi:hypothetical protein